MLLFSNGVKRTPSTDAVIAKLQPIFVQESFKAYVTSVLRLKEDQLRIIENYARDKGIIGKDVHLEFVSTTTLDGTAYPLWQVVWSKLLSKGIIINPPVPAQVLLDYFRDGKNKLGQWIQPSPHFLGNSFDIGGFNETNTAEMCAEILNRVKAQVGIKTVLLERANNCVHNDVLV